MAMNLKALLKSVLLENSVLKFFSLVLAITLWFFVMGEKKAEFSFTDVPIVLINKPADLVVAHQTAQSVNVRISGSRSIVATLSSNMIKAFIDLDGAQPGKTTYKNLIDCIKIPNGTKITSISPAELSLTLESTISKKVQVHLNLVEGPQEGYEVTQIAIQPEFVEVRLALSEAGKINKVITEPLYLSGVEEDIERELVLVLPGLDLPRSLSREKVKVSLSISEKIIERTLSNIPVGVINSSHRARVTPSTIQVKVKCPYRLAGTLSEDDMSASIDLEGVKPGKYLKKADIKLPGACSLLETVPLRFEVVVGKK
jgi:YbbR domain-containing protein